MLVVLDIFVVMMFVFVLFGMLMMFVLVLFFGLHALHDFFFLDAVAECLHQVQRDTPFLRGSLKSLLNPFVRLAAHIDNHVRASDGRDVLGRGLVAMHVHAVLDEQFQINRVGTLADHVL